MGHKKSLVWQARIALDKHAAYGQSKFLAKQSNGGKPPMDKIFSIQSMDDFKGVTGRFCRWVEKEHGCKTLAEAEPYAGEWLQSCKDRGLKPSTVRQYADGLGKLYQRPTTSFTADPLPTRHRADTTKFTGDKWKGHFSPDKHADLVDFCHATGLRRHEVAQLRPQDVTRLPDGRVQVAVYQGKGGKDRIVTALNSRPAEIAEAAAANHQGKVFPHIPKYAPIQTYRQDFANTLYYQHERDISTLPRSERYVCRGDRKGTVYDKAAMRVVTHELGHNRLSVIAQSYLRAK